MSIRHLLPLLLLALAAAPNASAQYQWRDANGRMVYSDMPPPASVVPSAVLKAPARPAVADIPGGSGATANASSGTAQAEPGAAAAPSATDRELEFRKRRLERADAERKAAESAERSRRAASTCADSRDEIRTLESGMRVTRLNERGEREALDDAQRAARLENARRTAAETCRSPS